MCLFGFDELEQHDIVHIACQHTASGTNCHTSCDRNHDQVASENCTGYMLQQHAQELQLV